MKRKIALSVSILSVIVLHEFFRRQIDVFIGLRAETTGKVLLGSEFEIVVYLFCWFFIPMLCVLLLFFKPSVIPAELGLNHNFLKGTGYGILASIPMLIGYGIFGTLVDAEEFTATLIKSAKAGFIEEMYFRSFIFGLLFFRAGWGYLPAMLINGILFGLGHLYQSEGNSDSIFILMITIGGAIGFSLMYAESRKNIWFLISLHFFMDLYWGIFNMSQNVIGGWSANIPRILTILFAVGITIWISITKGGFYCKSSRRWVNSQADEELI